MSFKQLFKFLDDLDANNHKDWMDENRKRYHETKNFFKEWMTELCYGLKEVNPNFRVDPASPKIFRINYNHMYNANLPTYKDHFGSEVDSSDTSSFFYLQFGVKESFIAGGYYRPDKEALHKIREAIDYDGDRLKWIVNEPSFRKSFGRFEDDEQLKTAPKGFPRDHQHIDLLRFKNFVVAHYPTRAACSKPEFMDQVIELYKEMIPFRAYLDKAVAFEEI